jgi:hypothetical protein
VYDDPEATESDTTRQIRRPRAVSIDSLANHSFGWNEELFIDLYNKKFFLNGVNGSSTGSRKGRLPCFGDVVITPHSKMNAIALCDAEQYEINYLRGDKIVVHISNDLALEFLYNKHDKSYTCIFTDEILQCLADHEPKEYGIHVLTCSENESLYSKREVMAAREAREMQKR